MRLLTWDASNNLSLTKDLSDDDNIPPYAILSHTWGEDSEEVTFADIGNNRGRDKEGYKKIKFCGEQARKDGYKHFWVDTCCINKDSHVELSTAITSMFMWYKNAAKCYTYLSDVSTGFDSSQCGTTPAWEPSFRSSRWFTRGWTLQELLAPPVVEFFSREAELLGTKETLIQQIYEITTIPLAALQGTKLSQFPIGERLRWTENRNTKKKEDKAYCLQGIFGVFIPLMYGEGDNALRRLQMEINNQFGGDVAGSLTHSSQIISLGLCLNSAPLIQPHEFIGRIEEIDVMSSVLRPGETSTEQRRIVLGGMGGIGKTQLAIAYARRYQSSYTSIIWLNATSESTLYLSLRSIVKSLISVKEAEELNNAQILSCFHKWLSDSQNARWLLIFDNNDEPDELDIGNFCPNIGHGSIIITTRLPDNVTGPQVRVRPLPDIDNSLDLLQVRSGRKDARTDQGAQRLAERLGGFPLALVTAGAYLRKSTITFQQYLDAYEQRWQVDRRRPLRLQDYPDRTLYTTWNLSYTRLQSDDPDAAHILRLLAYFDNQDVWYELLSAGGLEGLPSGLQQLLHDRLDLENAMTTLVDYCFLEVQTTTQSYSMHSCVHDWALVGVNKIFDRQLHCYALDCVAASIDHSEWRSLNGRKYARLAPHAARLVHPWFVREECLYVLDINWSKRAFEAAVLLTEQYQHSQAEHMFKRALAGFEKVLDSDDSLILNTLNSIGILYYKQNRLDLAAQMLELALAGKERAFGTDHILTLETVNNLGVIYGNQDKLVQAEQMLQRALVGIEQIYGANHTLTLEGVHNLGALYRRQGKLNEADHMFQRALVGMERAVGPHHLSTVEVVGSLGNLRVAQGKLAEAERMHRRALIGKENLLELNHPSTLRTINDLGHLYKIQGKLNEAEQMYKRVLFGFEQTSQAFHPIAGTIAHSLSLPYQE